MVKSHQVKICPKCSSTVKPDDKNCAHCGARLTKLELTVFQEPNYITTQFLKMNKAISGGSKSKEEQERLLQADMVKFFTECKEEVKIAAMSDALNILRYAVAAQEPAGTMRRLTNHGKLMGKLATAIEEFSRNGGVINVSEQLQRPIIEDDIGN